MPSIFMDSIAARHNMFPGAAVGGSPNLNFGGLPGMGGTEGMLAQMFLEPMLQNMLGPGFIPGQFSQTHNLYDHYRRRAQNQAMQGVMASAAESDRQQYASLLRGMAATAGVEWNGERERAAQMMASDMSKISPMLAQAMPDTFDRMHGSRGSAILMAQNMFTGGRYRIDPVTRMLGMSADTTSQITRELYDRLYGPGADLAEMKGMGAGRSGQLFDEMSRRGMLPRVLDRDEQMRGIARRDLTARGLAGDRLEGELGNTMDELRKLSSPELEMKVRQFEASRIGDRIKNMAGAVAAMKDVFGEMGRPDAPMSELIEGLQVLTQGGLATMGPERIEALVRDTANIARRTGMGMDNMTLLMATSAQRADAMGLDRVFGVTAGMEAGAFGTAFANKIGGSPAWGRADKERMIAIDSQLRLNAANSQVANQLAATARLGADVGFKAGSEAEAMMAAVKSGETAYTFGGVTRSVYADPGRWREMMAAGGVDPGLAAAYRAQSAYNQRFIDENGLTDLTRRLQADVDVAPRLNRAFQRAARASGIVDNATLGKLGQAAQEGLLEGIPPEDLQNPDRVADYLAGKLGIDKTDAAKMAQLRRTATLGWGNIEQMVKTNPRLRGYKTADQFVTAHRRSATAETTAELEEARQESRLQSALAGLGSGGPLDRLVDAVGAATPGTSTREIIAKTLGWTPEGEVGGRLESSIRDMEGEIRKFRDTDPEKIAREARGLRDKGTPEARMALKIMANKFTGGNVDALFAGNLKKTIREEALRKIRSMSPELRRQAEAAGLELGATASTEDAARAWTSLRDIRASGVVSADALAEKILHDDRAMTVMGPDGLSIVTRVQDRGRAMRELADRHAGGDVGVLFSTDAQRQRAREAFAEVSKGTTDVRKLEAEIEAAEAAGDMETSNAKRTELDGVKKKVTAAQNRLGDVGREVGTSGEKLARAGGIDAGARGQADALRKAQMQDMLTLQERLRAGRREPLTDVQKEALKAERSMRRRTDDQVLEDIFKPLGLSREVSGEDRAALARDVLRGDRAFAIRSAVPALQQLRKLKEGLTDEQFRDYLRTGPAIGASPEERVLYNRISAGKVGGGLAGIRGADRAAVTERLRDFAPAQRDPVAPEETGRRPGGRETTEITGTLTIPGLGEGRLAARGARR